MESSARRSRRGYTLVELMVTVTIMGILASIAVPLFKGYLYRSRANEATGFLMEIKSRQVSYRALYRQYYSVSTNMTDWYPDSNPGSAERAWPTNANWNRLGAQPPGRAVYFSYSTVAGGPGTTPANFGAASTLGYDGSDFWFVASALGDLNGDNVNMTFEAYSENQSIWCSSARGWE